MTWVVMELKATNPGCICDAYRISDILCRQHEAAGDASPPAAYQHDVDHRQSPQQDISLHLPQGGASFAAVQSSDEVRPQSSSALCLSLLKVLGRHSAPSRPWQGVLHASLADT